MEIKNKKRKLYKDGFDDALYQIKMTHLIIEEESKKKLDEKLENFIQEGWLLIGKTIFGYQQSREDNSYIYIHSQMIFKPFKGAKKLKNI